MAKELRKDGGVFQANHPADPVWAYQYAVPLDTVEVWNLPRLYQPPAPSSSDNDTALAYWEGWLDRGVHVTGDVMLDLLERIRPSLDSEPLRTLDVAPGQYAVRHDGATPNF